MKKTVIIPMASLLILSCTQTPKDFKSLLIGKWKQEKNEDSLEIKKDGTLEVIANKNGQSKKHQGVWTLYEEKKEVSMVLSAVLPVTMKIIELNDTTLYCNMVTFLFGDESIQEINYIRQ